MTLFFMKKTRISYMPSRKSVSGLIEDPLNHLSDDDFRKVHKILDLTHIYVILIVQLGKKLRGFVVSQIS